MQKTKQSTNHVLFEFYSVKMTGFAIFFTISKSWSDTDMKKIQRLRFWIEEYATCQILKFWIEFFTTRQIAIEKFHNVQLFEENFAFKESPLDCFYSIEVTDFAFFVLFRRARFWILMITTCQIMNKVFFNATVFEFNKLLRVWLYIAFENFFNASDSELKIHTKCQIWNCKIYNVSDFELKIYIVPNFAENYAIKKSRFVSFYSV